MADAAVANPGTSASVVVRLTRSETVVDVPNNRSYLVADLTLKVTAANGAGGPVDGNQWSTASLNSSLGSMGTWQGTYDLRPASSFPSLLLIHWEGWVTHDADGTKTVTFTFGFSGQGGTPLGVGSGADSITLTAIPRNRVKVGVSGSWQLADVYVGINGAWVPARPYVGVSGAWKEVSPT